MQRILADADFQLAAECCRWRYSSEGAERLSSLARKAHWSRFLRIIERHRVETLAGAALKANEIEPPAAVENMISRRLLETARENLRSAQDCRLINQSFSAAGVDVLFVKGLTLSALAYGDPFLKRSSDIDILVRAADVAAAATILRSLGYSPAIPADVQDAAIIAWHTRYKESAWLNAETGAYVELHSALADNARLIASIDMDSPRQQVEIARGLSLPTLAMDDLLAYLFVHGASSAWFRLKWLSDVCALLHRLGAGETERIYRYAVSKDAGRAPAQALLLAEKLFHLPLTSWLQKEIRRDAASRLLARMALRALTSLGEPTSQFGGTLPIHLTQLLLGGWGFAAGEAIRQAQAIAWRRRRMR